MNEIMKVQRKLNSKVGKKIICYEKNGAVTLEGRVNSWEEVIQAGYIAAKSSYRGVINNLHYEGEKEFTYSEPAVQDNSLENSYFDVVIVGAGIIGSSIARELSRWDISVLLIDKEEDVAMQTSSRNDGMIHPGLSPKIGTLKSKYNLQGNKMYTEISKDLDVKINRCGSHIVFHKKYEKIMWPVIKNKAQKLGLDGVRKLSYKELHQREPNLIEDLQWGFFIPSTAVTSPYKMTIAYAENAVMNGVKISLNTIVKGFEHDNHSICKVKTNRGSIRCKSVVNAAGVFADNIAEMAGDRFFTIHPRKGEIVLLDKKRGDKLSSVIGRISPLGGKKHSKGGGILRTLEGNILLGPDAYEQPNKEDFSTHKENVERLITKHTPLIHGISRGDVITYCAGTRAATYKEDFIIEISQRVPNLVYAAGIQSPGFASAPAIAKRVQELVINVLKRNSSVKLKEDWNGKRKAPPSMMELSIDEKNKLIRENKDYGKIICRCEGISKGEIIDCLNSPIPVRTVDGIKRRVRAGMGRCQGGFCMPPIMEIIEETLSVPLVQITKKGAGSNIVVGATKTEVKQDV